MNAGECAACIASEDVREDSGFLTLCCLTIYTTRSNGIERPTQFWGRSGGVAAQMSGVFGKDRIPGFSERIGDDRRSLAHAVYHGSEIPD
jgi:hypothetical protein